MMSSKCSDLGPSDKAPGGGPCARRLWVFLVLGALDIVFGLVTVGLYFNIQAVTTSNGLTEVFPGYIICLVVLIKGAIVLVLFWWRPSCLIFVCLSVAVGCGLFCVVSVILCATHVLSPIKNIDSCTYRKQESVCECQTSYRRDGLSIEFLPSEKVKIEFERTNSCDVIESILPVLLYAECALYLSIFIVCTIVAVLTFLIIKLEKRKILRNETYEEIFTVSGGSSCSDSDVEPEIETTRTGSASTNKPDVYSPFDGRNTCPPGILKNQDKHEILVDKTLSRSKSCDSIDLIYNSSESDKVKKGRLKEHRRRDRRAVTLNNLDTKQLLLILDLQKRYQEETRLLKSQGNLDKIEPDGATSIAASAIHRRAITPQPYRKANPNTIPRSHTPQPRNVYGGNLTMGELARNLQESLKEKQTSLPNKTVPPNKDTDKKETVANEGYVYMAPKPKSRPSAQKFFLPPQPIHRCRSTSPFSGPRQRQNSPRELPSQPISRPLDSFKQLPPAPIQRGGSAFQLVGHPFGPMYNQGSMSHDFIFRTPGEVFCENAIRENFKLYSSPFILQNTKQRRVETGASCSQIPPPYSGPPSYTDFLSRTDSAPDSGSEHIYETYENIPETKASLKPFSSPKRSPRKSRERVQTTESEDDVFLPVRLSPGGVLGSPAHPFIPGISDASRRRKPKKRSGRQKQPSNDVSAISHVKPGHNLIQSRDSTDQQADSEDCDNVYAVSAKAKPKSDTESERKTEKPKGNVPSKTSSNPKNTTRIDIVNEKLINGNGFLENGTIIADKTRPIHVTKIRGYSERPSESSGCTYEDVEESSLGVSSQTSLISSSDEITREFNSVIDEIHPGLGDPRVLETMI